MTRFDISDLRREVTAATKAEGLRPFARRTGVSISKIRSLTGHHDPQWASVVQLARGIGWEICLVPTSSDVADGTLSPPGSDSETATSEERRAQDRDVALDLARIVAAMESDHARVVAELQELQRRMGSTGELAERRG